jgi:hypothetical protein
MASLSDAVLAKRVDNHGFQWRMAIVFDKENGLIKLQPSHSRGDGWPAAVPTPGSNHIGPHFGVHNNGGT